MFKVPIPINETALSYAPNSPEKVALKAEILRQSNLVVDIPLIIGGEEIFTEKKGKVRMPHKHKHDLANFSYAGGAELKMAVEAAKSAKEAWSQMAFEHRAAIFLKAAELIATKYRSLLNAATMLGQSKLLIKRRLIVLVSWQILCVLMSNLPKIFTKINLLIQKVFGIVLNIVRSMDLLRQFRRLILLQSAVICVQFLLLWATLLFGSLLQHRFCQTTIS